jgi:ribosome-binding protein aMBF1 (putative translation factor)
MEVERFEKDPVLGAFRVEDSEMAAKKTGGKFRSKALDHAYGRYVGEDRERMDSFEEELLNARIVSQIYELRTGAGLTRSELAASVGTTASVICRLEDADYEGHSLSMLRRIADAVDRQIEIRFLPKKKAGWRRN